MKYFLLILLSIISFSCREEYQVVSDIKIGKEAQSLSEVVVHFNDKNIILSGGDNKYSINVADTRIATAKISNDTLKIKGLLEGETFANIFSHDKKAKLKIIVTPNDLEFSQDVIQIRPKDVNKSIRLGGGGEIVDIKINDPNQIMDAKWNGAGIIEIRAFYDGEATITAYSKNKEPKTLKVIVKTEGEINKIGYYSTRNTYLSEDGIFRTVMVVKRKGVGGAWLIGNTYPYDGLRMKITPITNPKIGEVINVNIVVGASVWGGVQNGMNSLTVEEIKKDFVILRGKGFKLAVPYER